MPRNPLTLTRQTLYDLVWSQPMVYVAKDFGISDVALAKRCRSVDVPVPPRGYWARKAAGQNPSQTPLSKYRTQSAVGDESATPQEDSRARKKTVHDGPEPVVRFPMPAKRLARSESPAVPSLSVAPTIDLTTATAAIRRAAVLLKHPDRNALPFSRGERSGPIPHISVSSGALDRALKFLDTFLRGAAELGW